MNKKFWKYFFEGIFAYSLVMVSIFTFYVFMWTLIHAFSLLGVLAVALVGVCAGAYFNAKHEMDMDEWRKNMDKRTW